MLVVEKWRISSVKGNGRWHSFSVMRKRKWVWSLTLRFVPQGITPESKGEGCVWSAAGIEHDVGHWEVWSLMLISAQNYDDKDYDCYIMWILIRVWKNSGGSIQELNCVEQDKLCISLEFTHTRWLYVLFISCWNSKLILSSLQWNHHMFVSHISHTVTVLAAFKWRALCTFSSVLK